MKNDILDQRNLDLKDIQKVLTDAGIHRFYETTDNKIIVQENDQIQVYIKLINGQPKVETKFPQIGNVVQIFATIGLLVPSFWLGLPYPWVIAILGGQGIAYAWYYPKIKHLKEQVERAL